MIGLIMLGSVINYLTRSTLAVAAPTVLKDLHITTQQYSWIVGAFQGAIMTQPICIAIPKFFVVFHKFHAALDNCATVAC
jgi:hypothetical protein